MHALNYGFQFYILSNNRYNIDLVNTFTIHNQYLCLFHHTVQIIKIISNNRFLQFGKEIFLHVICTFIIFCIWVVVISTVSEHSQHISNEQALVNVVTILQTLSHCLQICANTQEHNINKNAIISKLSRHSNSIDFISTKLALP